LTDGAALADTGRAEDHEQIQVPCRKSADILLQLRVSGKTESVRG